LYSVRLLKYLLKQIVWKLEGGSLLVMGEKWRVGAPGSFNRSPWYGETQGNAGPRTVTASSISKSDYETETLFDAAASQWSDWLQVVRWSHFCPECLEAGTSSLPNPWSDDNVEQHDDYSNLCSLFRLRVLTPCSEGYKSWNAIDHEDIPHVIGARGSVVGWGTMQQTRRSWDRFPPRSLDFSFNLIFPATLWPWGRLSL
jgi:hypothetical protein